MKIILIRCATNTTIILTYALLVRSQWVKDMILMSDKRGYFVIIMTTIITILALITINSYYVYKDKNDKLATIKETPPAETIEAILSQCSMLSSYKKQNSKFGTHLANFGHQTESFIRKKDSLYKILNNKFSEHSMAMNSYRDTIIRVSNLYIKNTKGILTLIQNFDESDYNRHNISNSRQHMLSRITEILTQAYNNNEEILIHCDMLLIELNQLDIIDGNEFSEVLERVGIEKLIKNTKCYDRETDFDF